MLKVIEFFSGIGAYAQALKELEIPYQVVGISEIDESAIKAYQIIHGKTHVLGDVKRIRKLPEADMWCYSFPCTDISIAGKMQGMARDSKTASSLLWEIERLLVSTTPLPRYLIMENVPTLVGKKYVEHFKVWLDFLKRLGYANFHKVMNAKDYGIAQNRKRLYLVSILGEADYHFPKKIPSAKILSDYLDEEVDEKYFISPTNFLYYTDLKDRNGFVRGQRFKPHSRDAKYAYTLTTGSGNSPTDNFILVPEATKVGMRKANVGDGIYINRPHQKRGVVQIESIPTLKTSAVDIGVLVESEKNLVAIRRLTPKECFRLMGWSSYDFTRVRWKEKSRRPRFINWPGIPSSFRF